MDIELAKNLRSKPSYYQKLIPRKTMCEECPHKKEVRNISCHIGDLEMFCLEEPHICNTERDGLCRGVVEKMIINDKSWKLSE